MRTDTSISSAKLPLTAQQHTEEKIESTQNSYKVIRRNGKLTAFSADKISIAMTKAFLDVEGKRSAASTSIRDKVTHLTQEVVNGLFRRAQEGGIVHIEDIQDHVELALMRSGEHKIARSYVLYREQRAQQRAKKEKKAHKKDKPTILHTLTATGERKPIDVKRLEAVINEAAAGLKNIDAQVILKGTLRNLFDDIPETEIGSALVMSARTLIDQDPDYSYVTARLLLDNMRTEALSFTYAQPRECTQQELGKCYSEYFSKYIKKAVELQHLDEELTRYDLKKLGAALQPESDLNFTYLGLQTLYDRYFIHHDNTRFELPQAFFMRVAMGLAINEVHREERAIEFYKLLSSFRFMSSTPTLFNSGSLRPQLSSCYLTTVPDDLAGIYDAIKDNALLSKFAGGLGNDWTPVRGLGSHIKGTNGESQGVVPFLKVVNDTAVAVNQCFAADTLVYTANGTKKIKDIEQSDVVLGQRGEYRQVKQKMLYNQTDPMVEINVKHSITPLKVTAGHPLWALQSVPMEQTTARTMNWLEKDKIKPQWVEAGELQQGDYLAQVIPKETIPVKDFTADDARLYGILLGDGHSSKEGLEWGVSGNPDNDTHLNFVQNYLTERGIHYWVKNKREKYMQISWSAGFGLAREATTGQFIRGEQAGFIFSYDELYNAESRKHIHRRFNHLPKEQTLALIHGLIETDGNVSRGTEITFTNTSQPLIDGLRYQLLRLGVPCAGQYGEREHTHTGQRANGDEITFNNISKAYDLRVPAIEAIAKPLGCKVLSKQNWLEWKGCLFSRLRSVKSITPTPFVYDLKVEGDHSYMTTNGLAHNGGKRKGAVCAYLETWHIDIEEFLELRKNTGDERRRTHDMNSANWVPDSFMKRVAKEQDWTLFSPDETPDLHDLYGKTFEKRYLEYEAKAARGEMRLFRTVKAVELWRKMLGMLFETGHPWLCFSGDTKVAVADGREPIAMKKLAESNEKFPVYSARPVSESALNFNNASQRYWIEEIKMATAFKSGTRDLVKVHLDDGSSFRCTEDHLLALKDGGYVRADESAGLSLCPFNRWQDAIRPNNRYIGRNKDPKQRQANMIWNFYNGEIPKGYVVDHIKNGKGDFISNLQLLTIDEHNKKTSLERMGENNPFYGKSHSEETRKKISENTKSFMTDEYKQQLSNKLKGKRKPDRYGLSNPDLITKGREFYNKYNTLSNKSWRKHYKTEGLPSAGYIENRFKYWSSFTDSCINNHKVVKVENTGKIEDVYDLSVEDNHNFFIVTNETDVFKSGVLVHNCFKDPSNIRYSNQHVGVVHSSNLCCMTADQRVVTDKGILTVKELYNLKCKNKVVGLDGIYNASEMLLPRPDAPIVEIQTREGYSHKVTPDHKVWVKDKGWIEAQHLEANDKLLIQQLEGLWGKEHNPELSYSMGLIAGDGTFSHKNVHIDVWEYDFHFIQSIEKKVHALLAGNTALNTTSTNTPTFAFNHKHKRARLTSAPLYRLLEKQGLSAKNKTRVPELIWKGDRETVAEYLRGLYQADEHIQTGADITILVLASKNLDFIKELQIIWANFGVKTSINKMRDACLQSLPDDKGGTKQYTSQALYRLLITTIQGCQIAEKILHLGSYKQSDACERYKQNLQKKGYQQKLYAHFTHLTPLPNEDAYCLTVDSETHAWTVNGLVTKNTEIMLHTDADQIAVCFPAGTQILTKNGQKPIELCDKEQVLVPFNSDLIPQQRFLTATLIPQGKKQIYEIITKNGITICATEEHPFLIQQPVDHRNPKIYEWRKLKELEKGDFIVCPLNTPIYDDIGQQDADFTAAGWMLGDGWMSSSYGACFAPHETIAQDFVLPILERWHQESPLGNNTPHSAPPTPYVQPNGVVNWHTQRKGFIDYVSKRFGFHRAIGPQKRIAAQIKQATTNQIASFLSGLFSADGYVLNDARRKKGGVGVTLSSASLLLLRDVQLLLKPFGIHGRIRGCSVKGRGERWQGTYEIKDRDSILNFTRFIGFSLTPNKQEKLQELLAKLSNRSAFQHSAVIDIVAKGEEEVFDLSLAEDHSFIANGLVVHNCNLGSVNLAAHTTADGLDMPLLEKTITTATRMLDNVIEYNYYSVPQARRSNLQHRPVGLGLMGFQDALYKLNIPYATEAAVEFADRSMEAISYYAIQGSNKLAKERGKYSTYEGSLWSRGILPIDSLELMEQERGEFFQVDRSQTLDWDSLRDDIKQHGMRNSNVMAIAPTACVSGDTLILSSEGLLPIESMAKGQAQWQTININIAQEGNLAHADQLYLNGFKDTLCVTTKRGSKITATPNHRIRVINQDGDYVWKYFSELAVGDEVVRRIGGHQALLADKAPLDLNIPERQHAIEKVVQLPEKLTADVALMLGLYMGDGYLKYSNRGHYTKKEGIGFAIHNDETTLTEHLRNHFSTWGATLLADVSKTESACTTHLVYSSQLVKWFEANQFNKQRGNFGEGSASAFIPNKILASNSEVLCAFLSGLFIADGTVNNRCVEVATVSPTLARQVKVALESLGILATLSISKAGTKGNRPVYRVRTSNVEATRLFLKYIGFAGSYKHQHLTERLADSHSMTDARRGHNIRSKAIITEFIKAAQTEKVDKSLLNPLACSKTNGKMNIKLAEQAIADYPALQATKLAKLLEKGDLYFEPIVSIEASENVTYDLQVPEKHTYVANGFVSHNTISNICGVSQSIEPTYQNMYVKSNLSGEFTVVNPYLINELKALNLWDDVMINDLKYFDGSVQRIDRVPENIKEKYATAFEIDSRWLVEAASRRQKWIDQGESLNLYLAEPSGKKLDDLYKLAWVRGLKTTYYLRTLAATHMEKSADTTQADAAIEAPNVCSILDPDCEACQ